jgi:hypothetical protein
MHPRPSRTTNEVVEIPNLDALLTLIDAGYNEISDWKVNTLCQCGSANNEPNEVFTHGMLYRQPDTVRRVAVMGKNAMRRVLGRWGVSTEIVNVQTSQSPNLLGV